MRLLLYNIRYAAGVGTRFNLPVPGAGYIKGSKNALKQIIQFIKSHDPDIVGLVEVDSGSIRSRLVNQAEQIGNALGHYSVYQGKYGHESIQNRLPIIRKQGNAFLAAPRVHGERFHYLDIGVKRLIIELELEEVSIYLVHLSLKYRHRHYQLRHLHDLIRESEKPVIVVGDFNTFWGEHEIYLFMQAARLRSANTDGVFTYPSRTPRKELDFFLYSDGIEVRSFEVPDVHLSDHLPLVVDFEVAATC